MEPEQIEDFVKTILTEDKTTKYFIHGTKISHVYYDTTNGKLYTSEEYNEMSKSGYDTVSFGVVGKVEAKMLKEKHILNIGAGWTISEEDYKEVEKKNFEESISSFFEKGLYCKEHGITDTSVPLEIWAPPKTSYSYDKSLSVLENLRRMSALAYTKGSQSIEEKRENLIEKLKFLYKSKNQVAELGWNTFILLGIPNSCFGDSEHITKLFEIVNEIPEGIVARSGQQLSNLNKLNCVIPKEYLKGAFYLGSYGFYCDKNEHFNSNKIVENGYFDEYTLKRNKEIAVHTNSVIDSKENSFGEKTIGKATINTSTSLKDQSRQHIEKDVLAYEKLINGQIQTKDD